jgi:hypothetical protein
VFRRSEGIPYFVEELARSATRRCVEAMLGARLLTDRLAPWPSGPGCHPERRL